MNSSFEKVDRLYLLAKEIESKMRQLPLYKERKKDLASKVMGLEYDVRYALYTLESYKKFIKKMVSFEQCMKELSRKNTRLNEIFSAFKETQKKLIDNFNDEDYNLYNGQILELKFLLNEEYELLNGVDIISLKHYANGDTIQCEEDIENGIRYFYISNRRRVQFPFKKIDISAYTNYVFLQNSVTYMLEKYSIERIEKLRHEKQIGDIKEKIQNLLSTTNKLIAISPIDWKKIVLNKTILETLLNELSTLILTQDKKEEKSFELYQQLKVQVTDLPTSEEKYIEQLKLKTLKLLKEYNQQKNVVSEKNVISKEELKRYMKSFFDYQMSLMTIQSLKNNENNKEQKLELQIKVYKLTLEELKRLSSKSKFTKELENEYSVELKKFQKDLFYLQNEDKPNVELYIKLKDLEEKIQTEPQYESFLLEYFETVQKLAEEEYLQNHAESSNEISNLIRKIEAQKMGLQRKKEVLNQYAKNYSIEASLKERIENSIVNDLEASEEELAILSM